MSVPDVAAAAVAAVFLSRFGRVIVVVHEEVAAASGQQIDVAALRCH
jgi:hypothetical protein